MTGTTRGESAGHGGGGAKTESENRFMATTGASSATGGRKGASERKGRNREWGGRDVLRAQRNEAQEGVGETPGAHQPTVHRVVYEPAS